MTAVRRAAWSSGDSDSIAALAGAFAGASMGASAWPGAWSRGVEHRERIRMMVAPWDTGLTSRGSRDSGGARGGRVRGRG
ncbi:ADP-ribosylglycohydrolase [Streptomyces sp. B4I13]|nr:ADP-ribosylglycohydrolase [Streptomyces sp. B4I13]